MSTLFLILQYIQYFLSILSQCRQCMPLETEKPDHSHQREEEIFVKTSSGIVKYAAKQTPVGPGSVLYMGSNEAHQFVNAFGHCL